MATPTDASSADAYTSTAGKISAVFTAGSGGGTPTQYNLFTTSGGFYANSSSTTVTTLAGLSLTAPTLTRTVTASGDINLSATGGPGSIKDELTLLLMEAI